MAGLVDIFDYFIFPDGSIAKCDTHMGYILDNDDIFNFIPAKDWDKGYKL